MKIEINVSSNKNERETMQAAVKAIETICDIKHLRPSARYLSVKSLDNGQEINFPGGLKLSRKGDTIIAEISEADLAAVAAHTVVVGELLGPVVASARGLKNTICSIIGVLKHLGGAWKTENAKAYRYGFTVNDLFDSMGFISSVVVEDNGVRVDQVEETHLTVFNKKFNMEANRAATKAALSAGRVVWMESREKALEQAQKARRSTEESYTRYGVTVFDYNGTAVIAMARRTVDGHIFVMRCNQSGGKKTYDDGLIAEEMLRMHREGLESQKAVKAWELSGASFAKRPTNENTPIFTMASIEQAEDRWNRSMADYEGMARNREPENLPRNQHQQEQEQPGSDFEDMAW